MAVVDIAKRSLLRMIDMPVRHTHMGPQDIKLSPDGSRFCIADSDRGGLWVLDGAATQVIGQIPTGMGAHGIYLSRNSTRMFVSNRMDNSVSVLDPRTGAVLTSRPIPNSSPDMGGVTADGGQLWLSGHYDAEVYVLSTVDGHLLARIPIAKGPHGALRAAVAGDAGRSGTRASPAGPAHPVRYSWMPRVSAPSTTRWVPVVKLETGLDRKTAAFAISSGRPIRPVGLSPRAMP